jgi:hypothetical protein
MLAHVGCCLCYFVFEQVLRGACIESGGQTERWFLQGRGNAQSELELAHLLLAALRDSLVQPEP